MWDKPVYLLTAVTLLHMVLHMDTSAVTLEPHYCNRTYKRVEGFIGTVCYSCGGYWWWRRTCCSEKMVYTLVTDVKQQCCLGWSGVKCDIPICHTCEHGGYCEAPGVCKCLEGYRGGACQFAVCEPDCVNGGYCITPDVCKCPPNTSGDRCQHRNCG